MCVHTHAQSWSILRDPMNYRLPGSSVHRIFQARILKWVAISSSRGSSQSRDRTCVSCIGRQIPYHWGTWEDQYTHTHTHTHTHTYAKSLQLCPTLCNPMNYSLPVSSVHGILQARILEWAVISFSRGSSQPRNWTCVSCIGRQIPYHWATWEAIRAMNRTDKRACPPGTDILVGEIENIP